MNIIKIDFWNPDDAFEIVKLAESNNEIDVIQEKNFSGDITTLELYISMGINILTVLVSIINSLIQKGKISSVKINGESIEINNISQDLVEKVLREKLILKSKNESDK